MIVSFIGKEVIVNKESERDLRWGTGTKILCLDTGKYYIIANGTYKTVYSASGLQLE